jgi:serine/threonine protein kinase
LANITTLSELEIEPEQIGKGAYGTVSKAMHKASGIRVAIKKIDKHSLTSVKIRETLKREIAI